MGPPPEEVPTGSRGRVGEDLVSTPCAPPRRPRYVEVEVQCERSLGGLTDCMGKLEGFYGPVDAQSRRRLSRC